MLTEPSDAADDRSGVESFLHLVVRIAKAINAPRVIAAMFYS
jgi:hypothetical protein